MPRKKSTSTGVSSTGTAVSSSSTNNLILAPGGGTSSDISHLSSTLSLPTSAILAIMNCEGQGMSSSSSRRSGAAAGGGNNNASAAGMDPSMMNVWGDFMNEEMETAPRAATTTTSAAAAPVLSSTAAAPSSTTTTASAASGPRNYILPIPPRMRLNVNGTKKSNKQKGDGDVNGYDLPMPGLLAQTGTLDSSV
jgi:hypothetical protein